jgi:Cu/Zn superoxide dismutase
LVNATRRISAGPHFNPEGKKHGMKDPDGPHAGDLPDIEVGADGTVKSAVISKQVTLGGKNSLFSEGGTALVIHVDPDDERTDPAGNSGGPMESSRSMLRPLRRGEIASAGAENHYE